LQSLQCSPRLPSCNALLLRGGKGKGEERRGREGRREEEGEEKGGERKGMRSPTSSILF